MQVRLHETTPTCMGRARKADTAERKCSKLAYQANQANQANEGKNILGINTFNITIPRFPLIVFSHSKGQILMKSRD